MDKLSPKHKKIKCSDRNELMALDKDKLVDKILQLEAHNCQLKNILSRSLNNDADCDKNRKNRQFDFGKCSYRKVLLRLLYLGWDYQGLAVQEDSNNTVEHHLFHALTKSCLIQNREMSNYHRCGRTDKGVSSFGQVISITLRSNSPKSIDGELPYCKMLNRLLPKEIRAISWMPLFDDMKEYSARFDCKKRQYRYYFPRSNLNIGAMSEACSLLIGSHDFRHLCKMDVGNGVTEFTREIFRADILAVDENDAENPTSMFYLRIEGNAFLWHQIRCIMGVLLLIGQGKETYDVIKQLLDVNKYPRKPQYNLASDFPLNLFHCTYDLEGTRKWYYDKDELKCVLIHLQNEWTKFNIKSTMIKDCIHKLEKTLKEIPCKSETDANNSESERESVIAYDDCLIQGVKPRTYTPLMERETCSSLEERIEYYRKKKKIDNEETNKI